jgi:hypothetical protein
LLLIPVPPAPFAQERVEGSDFIRVTEETWKLGEVRSYTLFFDQVPFGREAIRLIHRAGDGRDRQSTFGETRTLDFRALGQEGFLTIHATIQYDRGRGARTYSVQSESRDHPDYLTYPKTVPKEARSVLNLDLRDSSPRMRWEARGESRETPLPQIAGAMLVDPLSMVTWERLFLGDRWMVGESRPLDLFLPDGPVRFDYHLIPQRLEPPNPVRIRASMTVEKKETIEVFSVAIPAFRCGIPEIGLTLWVSSSGGILKYDDGRGLVASLER